MFGGSPGIPTGDIGLFASTTRPACDGTGIVVLFSATNPGAYEPEVQQALNDHPGSTYLRTDESCSSLNKTDQGNPIYPVYQSAGCDPETLCDAAGCLSGYPRLLDNPSDPNSNPC